MRSKQPNDGAVWDKKSTTAHCPSTGQLAGIQRHDDTPDYDSGEVRIPFGPHELHSAGALSIEAFRLHVDACGEDYLARGGAFLLPDRGAPEALQELVRWGWLIPAGDGKYTLCHSTPEPVTRWYDAQEEG